jgi:hypothetical protein
VEQALGLRSNYTLEEVFALALKMEKLLSRNFGRSESTPTRQGGSGSMGTKSTRDMVCHYCQKPGHRQSECRKKLADANTATRALPATRVAAESKPARSPADLSKVKCFSCEKTGHYSRDCPSRAKDDKVKGGKGDRKFRRIARVIESPDDLLELKNAVGLPPLFGAAEDLPDLLNDSDDEDAEGVSEDEDLPALLPAVRPESAVVDADRLSRELVYLDDMVYFDEMPELQERLRRLRREQNPPNDIIALLLLNGIEVEGIVDSGAQTSIVSVAFCERNLLTIKPAKEGTHLKLADESTIPRVGTTTVTMKSSTVTIVVELEVMYLGESELIIGLDLFPALNISIHGVPCVYPSRESETKGEEEGEHKSEGSSYDIDQGRLSDDIDTFVQTIWDPRDQVELMQTLFTPLHLSETYLTNINLPPDAFATIAEAELKLDTGLAEPVFRPPYRCPDKLMHLVDARIKEDLERGVIAQAPRDSPWNSPLCVVPKKDANGRINPDAPSVRVCIDTRGLNELMKDRTLRVPLINDLFRRTQGFRVATALDLKDGYYNIKIAEEDQIKLTFTWRNVRYLYRRAPFGLKVMVPFFQGFMETLLEPFLEFCLVYLDDIIIFTVPLQEDESMEETCRRHRSQVLQVLQCLNDNCMRINPAKSHFGFSRLRVLGHILTGTSRAVDPEKLLSLKQYPAPTSHKQVQAFLGFVNYLRDYIPLYSTLAAPLEALRNNKNVADAWRADPRCQASFEAFLKVLQKAPILNFAVPDVPFRVHTDASDRGVGAVLSQLVEGQERYILFVAKALNPAQRNYSATKRELYAIIFALNYFRDFLYLSHFELFTDHRALTYIFTQKQLTPMLSEWLGTLLDFDFAVTHLPGIKNVLADALSRCYPDFVWEERGADSKSLARDHDNIKVGMLSLQEAQQIPRSELIDFVRSRMDKSLPSLSERQKLMEQEHAAGHFGGDALFKKLWSRDVYWPSMKADCTEFVSSCMQCLRYNVGKAGFHPQNSIQAKYPFEHIAVDNFQMESTSPRGYNYVLVVVDIATRFVLLYPLENEKATSIAKRLWECFCLFGVPKVIQSDRGAAFVNKIVSKLTLELGVDHRLVAPYNPRANGAAERFVQTAKAALLKCCEGNIIDFDLYLPAVQFAMNTKESPLHGGTPFSLMLARPVNALQDYRTTEIALLTSEQLQKRNEAMMQVVYPELELKTAGVLRKRDAAKDASRTLASADLEPRTQVMIKDLKRSKAEPRWLGPYQVLAKVGSASYRLLDSTLMELPRLVPRDQMKVIKSPLWNFEQQPAFEVDHIVNHRLNPDTHAYEYLVNWKHYPDDSTWEPVSSFDDIDPIRRYWGARRAGVEALKMAKQELKSARARTRKRRAEREVAALQVPSASASAVPAVSASAVPVVPAASVPAQAQVALAPAIPVPVSADVPSDMSAPIHAAPVSALQATAPAALAAAVPVSLLPPPALAFDSAAIAPAVSNAASVSAAQRPRRSQQAQRAPRRFHYM